MLKYTSCDVCRCLSAKSITNDHYANIVKFREVSLEDLLPSQSPGCVFGVWCVPSLHLSLPIPDWCVCISGTLCKIVKSWFYKIKYRHSDILCILISEICVAAGAWSASRWVSRPSSAAFMIGSWATKTRNSHNLQSEKQQSIHRMQLNVFYFNFISQRSLQYRVWHMALLSI